MLDIKNVNIVGGTWDDNNPKTSGIIQKIADTLYSFKNIKSFNVFNGGRIVDLHNVKPTGELILWMPNIDNETEKHYPVKPVGSVLICSKVMRDGYTAADSVSRIFKMHGNAVIEIHKEDDNIYSFVLRDALANVWVQTSDISELLEGIIYFYEFTRTATRVRTNRGNELSEENLAYLYDINKDDLDKLININMRMQEHIMVSCGDRFFGNISTRCQKLFPTMKSDTYMFVSPRNTNKKSLTVEDMIVYDTEQNEYYGINKPSVDSPVQAIIYNRYPNINYMIHGHATITMKDNSDVTTKNYKLCGDITEADEISGLVDASCKRKIVNLKSHGFLLMAETLDSLNAMVDDIIINSDIKIK